MDGTRAAGDISDFTAIVAVNEYGGTVGAPCGGSDVIKHRKAVALIGAVCALGFWSATASADVQGQTQWENGATRGRGTDDPIPTVTIQARNARPNTTFEPISTTDPGCSADLRSMGPPYLVYSDAVGYIAPVTVRVHEGGQARPPGTYYLCFRTPDPSINSATAPVTLVIGTATTTTAPAPTTTTSVPPENVCNISPPADARAIEAAIAACPAGSPSAPTTVRFPAGATYNLADRIVLLRPHDMVIDLNGSTLVATWGMFPQQRSQLTIYKGRNLKVDNAHFVGTFEPDPILYPQRQQVWHLCEAQAGVAFWGGRNVTAEDSTARRPCGDGFVAGRSSAFSNDYVAPDGTMPLAGDSLEFPEDVTFQRLDARRVARTCWSATGGVRVKILDNYCEDAWSWATDAEKDAEDEPVIDYEIARNTIRDVASGAIMVPVGSTTHLTRGIRIHDNLILTGPTYNGPGGSTHCLANIQVGSFVPGGPGDATWDAYHANRLEGVEVYANTIHNAGHFVAFHHVDGGSIRDNAFHLIPGPDGNVYPPSACGENAYAFATDSTGVTITNNTVTQHGPH